MKKNEFLSDLHIGGLIKEIAVQKHFSSVKIAETICRYKNNSAKIYKLEDMDINDLVKITYLMEYNFLEKITKKYQFHLPEIDNFFEQETDYIEMNMFSKHITNYNADINYNFLRNIHIGREIKRIAQKKGWSEQYLATKLSYSQSTVNELCWSESIKVKKLMFISEIMQHNFIKDVYLSRIRLVHPLKVFDRCKIIINEKKITITKPYDESFLIVYRRIEE